MPSWGQDECRQQPVAVARQRPAGDDAGEADGGDRQRGDEVAQAGEHSRSRGRARWWRARGAGCGREGLLTVRPAVAHGGGG